MSVRSEASTRADYRAFRVITTRFMDNDELGHMNNAVHYALFDTAVCGWLLDQDILDTLQGEQVAVVVETGCRYFAEMAFPDVVTAGIRVVKLGRSSVRYEIGLFRNDEDQASAEGFFVHVYVNRKSREPRPIEPELRQAMERIQL